jgi:hypothetical protein
VPEVMHEPLYSLINTLAFARNISTLWSSMAGFLELICNVGRDNTVETVLQADACVLQSSFSPRDAVRKH